MDAETQERLDRQRILMQKDDRSESGKEKSWRNWHGELERLGFSRSIRDPIYELFLKAWAEGEDPEWRKQGSNSRRSNSKIGCASASKIVEQLQREMGSE